MGFEEDWGGATPGSPTDTSEPSPTGDPSGDTSPGKHAILMVPDFKNGVGRPMVSYLRLGDAHSQSGPAIPNGQPNAHPLRVDLGEDLAALVQGFTDDTRERQYIAPAVGPSGGLEGWPVVPGHGPEEVSSAADQFSPNPPDLPEVRLHTTDARRAESAKIHTKGGWRDHSDGNRITTTRGDKVEVIRGNYKLIVLGRSDVPTSPTEGWDNATGMELAGGNVDTSSDDLAYGMDPDVLGAAPSDASRRIALETTYVWYQNLDGTWGWRQTTNVGSATDQNYGSIVTNTWVDYQETNLGSPTRPVQRIVSSTFAGSISQATTVTGGDALGEADGSLTQTTNAVSIRNAVVASNTINNTTAAILGISNATASLSQLTAQLIGANIVLNGFGVGLELDAAAVLAQLIVAGANATCWVVPVVNDEHLFVHNDMHAGAHIDHHMGLHVDLHDGEHVSYDPNPITIHNARITVTANSTLEVDANNKIVTSNTTLNANQATAVSMAQEHIHF
jgi:hypothetical protein